MKKAVIFDMDGLMIDSERLAFEGFQHSLNELGLTISFDYFKTLLGKTFDRIVQLLKEEYGNDLPAQEIIENSHRYIDHLFDTQGVPLKKGLIELLTYLKENNYKTIVATSSRRNRVDHILELADVVKYFDDSICGDEVTNGKPNPEVFLRSCEKLGVTCDEAIVLEDSEAGIQAAYNGNIDVICIPDLIYPTEEYAKMTTKILDSLDQVIDFLKGQ